MEQKNIKDSPNDEEGDDDEDSDEEEEESKESNENAIDIAQTIQQGSFLPAIGLISKGMIDPKTYTVDN